MDCSIKNNSLRHLVDDDYCYKLWEHYTLQHLDNQKKVLWNLISQQAFFIEFRRTITLEQLRLMKLRDFILKINKLLYEWEDKKCISIISVECSGDAGDTGDLGNIGYTINFT